MPLVRVLADMELNGVCLDTEALQDTSKIFTERMKQYEQEIYKELEKNSISQAQNK